MGGDWPGTLPEDISAPTNAWPLNPQCARELLSQAYPHPRSLVTVQEPAKAGREGEVRRGEEGKEGRGGEEDTRRCDGERLGTAGWEVRERALRTGPSV